MVTKKKQVYIDFVRLLISCKVNLFVFRHTFEEFIKILDNSIYWIEKDQYDPIKASRSLRYFVENDCTASDIECFILNIEPILTDLQIKVIDLPDPNIDQIHQIDEKLLTDTIVKIYKDRNPNFDEEEKDYTIYQDVKSISAIYKLRKGHHPLQLKDAKQIFITTNATLAYSTKVFEATYLEKENFFIPAVLTDVFIGTLIWINSPAKSVDINEKRLIANCYAAMQPSKSLIKKLANTADKLRGEGEISEEEVVLLKESRTARNLLQEETLGDPNRFSDKTVTDILAEMRYEIRREEQLKYEIAKDQLSKENIEKDKQIQTTEEQSKRKEEELLTVKSDKEYIESNLEHISEIFANILGGIFYFFSIVIIILVSIYQYHPGIVTNEIIKWLLRILAVIFTTASLITGFNIKGIRNTLKAKVKNKIISFLKGNKPVVKTSQEYEKINRL
jgi:hypothetical protein